MLGSEDQERLYNAIFSRKSVRKFHPETLDEETLESLLQKTGDLYSLLPDEKAAFRVLKGDQLKGIVSAKAPHYLALYADRSEDALINASCQLQQMDLWLSANGLGSCWLGMPRPVADAAEADGLPYVVVLAFGKPAETAKRESREEFKRKKMSEITDTTGMESLLEPVRLAPSATNRQAWYLSGGEGAVHLYGKPGNAIARKMVGAMHQMDMGIALCHLWLSASHEGRFERFSKGAAVPAGPAGYSYVWTADLSLRE